MRKFKFRFTALCLTCILSTGFLCACSQSSQTALSEDEYAPVSSLTMETAQSTVLSGKMHFCIYYANAQGNKLVAETKLIDYNKDYKRADALAKAMLEQMFLPPQNSSLQKTMPEGSSVISVVVAGDIATVNLNEAFYKSLATTPKAIPLILASIVSTLTELKEITYVSFLCEGNLPSISGNFSKLTRNSAVQTASAEIVTLAEFNQSIVEAGIAAEAEPELE